MGTARIVARGTSFRNKCNITFVRTSGALFCCTARRKYLVVNETDKFQRRPPPGDRSGLPCSHLRGAFSWPEERESAGRKRGHAPLFVADKSESTVRIDVHGERDAVSLFPSCALIDASLTLSQFLALVHFLPLSAPPPPSPGCSSFIGHVELVGRLTGCASFLQRDIFLDEFDGLFMASMWEDELISDWCIELVARGLAISCSRIV